MFVHASLQRRLHRVVAMTVLLCAGWASAVACSSSSESGVEATLKLSSVDEPALMDGKRSFQTDQGYQVDLAAGFLVLEHLEVQPCLDSQLSWFWRPALAYAHSGGNPRRLAAPVFVDLMQPGTELTIGKLNPPAGSYCAFQQSLGPADEDTPGVPSAAVGQSVHLELTVNGAGLAEERALTLESDILFDGFYAIEPMLLDDQHRSATIRVVHRGSTWFDGIDFQTADDERVLQKFLRNFRDSVEVSWQ